jgi:predicted ATPase with chaperone activity
VSPIFRADEDSRLTGKRRVTVNLAADLRKGSEYDLPIAVGLLIASEVIQAGLYARSSSAIYRWMA